MNKVVLKIYDDQYIGVNLTVNDKPVQEFLPFDKRLNALEKANNQLDTDVLEVSSTFKDDPLRIYACSITDDRYLHDVFLSGRKNTIIWYYYLIELIDYLDREMGIDHIDIKSCFIPRDFVLILRSRAFSLKVDLKYFVFGYLVRLAYFLKHFNSLSFLISGFFSKKIKFNSNSTKNVLIDIPRNFDNHRYGLFLDKIKDDNNSIYVDITNGIVSINNTKNKILSLLRLEHIPSIYKEFFGFKKSIAINKNKIRNENLFFNNIKDQNILLFFRNLLLIASLREFFRKQKIEFILIKSDLNNNLKKIFMLCAKERSIPCVSFLPRPLSLLKPAERIISDNGIDLSRYILPDIYQTSDINSYEVLISQGISSENIVLSERINSEVINNELPVLNENIITTQNFLHSVILLLGGKNSINEKLINIFLESHAKFDRVLFSVRAHPSQPLTSEQKNKLSQHIPNWFDATKKPYGHVPAKYKLVFSTSSTAPVEAAKSGCGVIWCPYLDEESLLMYPIMKKFGHIVTSDNELIEFLTKIFQHEHSLQDFSANCAADAKKAFEAINSVNEGYQSLKMLLDNHKSKHVQLFQ